MTFSNRGYYTVGSGMNARDTLLKTPQMITQSQGPVHASIARCSVPGVRGAYSVESFLPLMYNRGLLNIVECVTVNVSQSATCECVAG